MYSLVAVMKEKVDRLTAARTNVTDELVKEAIHDCLERMSKLLKRYRNMKEERLDERASDPETYRLLDADFILERNGLLGQRNVLLGQRN
jgi:vacuolar-type H+-ATPase subunit E/Vma4